MQKKQPQRESFLSVSPQTNQDFHLDRELWCERRGFIYSLLPEWLYRRHPDRHGRGQPDKQPQAPRPHQG